MEFNSKFLLVGFVLCGFFLQSQGHSYVTSPQSRSNQKQSESGCRGPACLGPCDTPLANMKGTQGTYARGSTINVQWPRNNHAGGFIRFAWAPTANSDSASAFDTNVQQINCHEVGGCGPSDPTNPNGGDNGTADGSVTPCQTSITVPGTATDGAWTLQWAWFGGAFALGDYYSCVDIVVSGGTTSALKPAFKGGDYSNPGQQVCKFFNTNELHVCVDEPCSSPIFPASAQETGAPAFLQKNADGSYIFANSSTSSPSPVSTPTPAPTPVTPTPVTPTPAAPTPVPTTPVSKTTSTSTTGRVSTSTTGKKTTTSTSTTGKKTSTSTSSSAAVPVPPPSAPVVSAPTTPAPTVSSSSCTVGQMKCVSMDSFSMCVPAQVGAGSWGPAMGCSGGTVCQQAGSLIQCGWPA